MPERTDHAASDDREAAFDRVAHEYYQQLESGKPIDRQAFINQHAAFESELLSFFADLDHLGDADHPLESAQARRLDRTLPTESSHESLQSGKSVRYIGEYRILGEIGRGGMGVVFKALQEKLERPVALKMILSGTLATRADVERFQREAKAAAKLSHPNIVSVHEIGTHDGHHFYTMDFVEGNSLAHWLRGSSMVPREAAKLVRSLARATHHAHENGVLHRDLKPANVLIDQKGVPHIVDFGLAKSIDLQSQETQNNLTQSGQVLGTPGFMSPEQALSNRESIGVATDVYALGAILYAAVSGKAPFVGDSIPETLQRVVQKEALPLHVLVPDIPKDLEVITHKCLQKDPTKRYQNAKALAEDLSRYLHTEPIHGRPLGRFAHLQRSYKRNPAVFYLMFIAATAILAAISIGSSFAVYYAGQKDKDIQVVKGQDFDTNREGKISALPDTPKPRAELTPSQLDLIGDVAFQNKRWRDAVDAYIQSSQIAHTELAQDAYDLRSWRFAIAMAEVGEMDEANLAYERLVKGLNGTPKNELAELHLRLADALHLFPQRGQFSQWMPTQIFLQVRDALIWLRQRPITAVEGRVWMGELQFRGKFDGPCGVRWWSESIATTEEEYQRILSHHLSKGHVEVWHHSFVDEDGNNRHSAIFQRWPLLGPNNRIEGEAFARNATGTGRAFAQTNMYNFAPGSWTDNTQLLWVEAKPGDRLRLGFQVADSGEYEVSTNLTRAPDFGIISIEVDDVLLQASIDLFSDQVSQTDSLKLGMQHLEAGPHHIDIIVTGRNPLAKNYGVGLDYMQLVRQ